MNILFIIDRLPFPVRKDGISIRYFPIIEYLATKHTVDILLIENERKIDLALVNELNKKCNKIFIVKRPDKIAFQVIKKIFFGISYLNPWGTPAHFYQYDGNNVLNKITNQLEKEKYSCVVYIWQKYAYLMPQLINKIKSSRFIIDFIDSPALIYKREINLKPTLNIIKKIRQQYELFKIKHWEHNLANKMDGVIYITSTEAQEVNDTTQNKKIFSIPNGVFIDDMYNFADTIKANENQIGFIGNMGYKPNIKAAIKLHDDIFIDLNHKHPNTTLSIIGRNPAEEIRKLSDNPNVTITGAVDNIWEYIYKIKIAVFPMVSGAGMQNKVLEALSAGKPVLTTEIGNKGINAELNNGVYVCHSNQDFINTIIKLLNNKDEYQLRSNQAKEFARKNYGWNTILEKYENCLLDNITR